MNLEAGRVADLAGRPLSKLTRRDVALALLTVPAADALGSLPGLRRGMLAVGNPLSAGFWASAEATLTKIADDTATVGDVRTWLEATGTEPKGIIGLHVWDEQSDRSQLAAEMHTRLVSHLEEQVAAGEVDPDLLAAADPEACRAYIEIQERWMTSPLPDGRVPMDVLLDEKDEEYMAEWDAADAEALAATQALLGRVRDRPLPQADLRRAAGRLRRDLTRAGWPGRLLTECSGLRPKSLPADDTELWLSLAAGVASPQGPDDWGRPGPAGDDQDDTDSEIAAICAIDHFDWLAVITALAEGGPGTPASATDLAAYVRDYDPEDLDGPDQGPAGPADGEEGDDDEDVFDDAFSDDDLTLEGLFLPVTSLWQVLGAIDDDERLTSLGWWGLPEAMLRVWAPSTGTRS
ncbi:MAG TPA: hypothetical protein VFQ68_34200 [Streptosporangiaceae bacterium]|nr:hypothetical protein [Streptosporangiaceae bacterium]